MPAGSARLFAALDPPREVGEELLRWARGALRAGSVGSGAQPTGASSRSAGSGAQPRGASRRSAGSGAQPRGVSPRSSARRGEHAPRVLAPDSLHVTLMFLGERPFAEIDALAAALDGAAERNPACELETGAPVWLPPRRPRALAVEVHDDDGILSALARDVAETLCAAMDPPAPQPPRRFRAHVTLARLRSTSAAHDALPPTPSLRFVADELGLYRSHLDPHGARYERIAAAALSG